MKQTISLDGGTYTWYFYEDNHIVLDTDAAGNATAYNTYSGKVYESGI